MPTENSKIRKFCPRSETCKNFTAQLPVVAKLRAFEVCRQNLMIFMIFMMISSKILEILGNVKKCRKNDEKSARILEMSKVDEKNIYDPQKVNLFDFGPTYLRAQMELNKKLGSQDQLRDEYFHVSYFLSRGNKFIRTKNNVGEKNSPIAKYR